MIKSIFIIVNNQRTNYLFDKNNVLKTIIDCKNIIENENSFDIEITFDSDIKKFRNHDYNWISVNNNIRWQQDFYLQKSIYNRDF